MDPPIDPDDHSVAELEAALADVDDPDALTLILDAERAGQNRVTAIEAIEDRLRAVGADPATPPPPDDLETTSVPGGMDRPVTDVLLDALRYPWDGGGAGVTLVIGGIITLLSPLVIPALFVLGYELRVVETVLAGEERPPTFGDVESTFLAGVKGAIVVIVIVVLPLAIGTAVLAAVAIAAGGRFTGGQVTFPGSGAFGPVVFGAALLLTGLALVVWYVAPAALVHLARTRRLRAAFVVEDIRELLAADEFGSAWLLALAVFGAAGVVLAVLYAAAIGVIVSGFVTFYAFTAMAYLYAHGAEAAGFGLDLPADDEDDPSEAPESVA